MAAICAKVFQKFPDFVQRCKEEAFEALSDPKYSGKMKVNFGNRRTLPVCKQLFDLCNYTVLLFAGFTETAQVLSAKEGQSAAFLSFNQGGIIFFMYS